MLIQAGELNERITIESLTSTTNDFNEPVGEWATAFKAWAKVRPVASRDLIAADRPLGEVVYNFILRSSSNTRTITATSGHRIAWGGAHYYIVGAPMSLDSLRGFIMFKGSSAKVNDV